MQIWPNGGVWGLLRRTAPRIQLRRVWIINKIVTFRIRALVVPATLAAVPLAAATSPSAPASGPVVVSERAVVSHPAAVVRGAAIDGAVRRGLAWGGGGLVARTSGRVFFTLDGVDYACSGSTVGGSNPNVVVTAAHCVSDGAGGWAVNWTFVPGFDRGSEPYGSFTARTYYVSGRWAHGADEDDDIAFVDMRKTAVADGPGKSSKAGSGSRSIGDVVGAQPIAFGYRGGSATVFGYPAAPPFNGSRLDYCQGPVVKDPYGAPDAGLSCTMTEGDSGGPWLSVFDPRTGIGVITGVTSFKYSGHNRTLYSANLGATAQALYNRAEKGLSATGHRSRGPRRSRWRSVRLPSGWRGSA